MMKIHSICMYDVLVLCAITRKCQLDCLDFSPSIDSFDWMRFRDQRASLYFTMKSKDAFVRPQMQLMCEVLLIFERDYPVSHTPN